MLNNTIILACSSLKDYIERTQEILGTNYAVRYLNRIYHRDPAEMREHILQELENLPEGTETVLAAMGFCGGSWEGVAAPCRIVIAHIDDCVSLLLQGGDDPISDLKTPGHLYVREKMPNTESFHKIFEQLTAGIDEETKSRYHRDWQNLYSNIDIMDTGINDCRTPEYRDFVQADADWLNAELSYVSAGTHMLEKLLSGNWDEQFLILQKGEISTKQKVLL